MPRVTCLKCGADLHNRSLKRHQQSEACQNRQILNANTRTICEMSGMIKELKQEVAENHKRLNTKVDEIVTRPQVVHNHTTIKFIMANKEPLSLADIEASVAMNMQAAVLRDGAQGIAQFVVIKNDLPNKIHISDKSRNIAKYLEPSKGEGVFTDKGLEEILSHVFVKFGRDGEIVVDRLYDELEQYMTEQNENGSWVDEFYNQQMMKLGKVRLEWKKASEGHDNKLRKDVARAIVRRCQ